MSPEAFRQLVAKLFAKTGVTGGDSSWVVLRGGSAQHASAVDCC